MILVIRMGEITEIATRNDPWYSGKSRIASLMQTNISCLSKDRPLTILLEMALNNPCLVYS